MLSRLLMLAVLAIPCWGAYANGYTYRRTVTIDHTKVPNTDQTNFAKLFSGTYSYLAHTTHGGLVTDLNGYDIIFTSDAAGSTKLDHEIETYNHETGACVFHVRVPTVATASDTVVYLFYANAAITTSQQAITGTWNTNYVGVWHLNDNAATTAVVDSTSYARNLTMQGSVNTSAVSAAGKLGNGFTFVRASGHRAFGANSSDYACTSGLVEVWVNVPADYEGGIVSRNHGGAGPGGWRLSGYGSGSYFYGAVYIGYTPYYAQTAAKSAAWHHVAIRCSGGNLTEIFLDGAVAAVSTAHVPDASSSLLALGPTTDEYFGTSLNGSVDEFRISNSARSADWVATSYNNQSDPATFYALGAQAEYAASAGRRRIVVQ